MYFHSEIEVLNTPTIFIHRLEQGEWKVRTFQKGHESGDNFRSTCVARLMCVCFTSSIGNLPVTFNTFVLVSMERVKKFRHFVQFHLRFGKCYVGKHVTKPVYLCL